MFEKEYYFTIYFTSLMAYKRLRTLLAELTVSNSISMIFGICVNAARQALPIHYLYPFLPADT